MDPTPIEKICPIMPVKNLNTYSCAKKKSEIFHLIAPGQTACIHTASKMFGLWSNEKPPMAGNNKGTPRLTRAITQALTKGASRP